MSRIRFIYAYELILCLHVFSQIGPSRRADCWGPTTYLPHKKWKSLVKWFIQAHNKRTCWVAFHAILFMLSTKQGNCKCHFLKSLAWIDKGIELRSTDCKAGAFNTVSQYRCETQNIKYVVLELFVILAVGTGLEFNFKSI